LNQYLNDKIIIDIYCGVEHSLVLTNDGDVYAWGRNNYGQIGNGEIGRFEYQSMPYHVKGFDGQKSESDILWSLAFNGID